MVIRDRKSQRRSGPQEPIGGGGSRWGLAWIVGAAVVLLGVLFALLLMAARPAAAQELADFDYENLSLRGVMLEAGYAVPSGVEGTGTWGVRMDLGFLGPGVRVTTGFSRWSSFLERGEVRGFQSRLEDLVEAETGERPSVDLGRISLSDVAIHADAHVVWGVPLGFLTYAGAGGTAHVMRGGGPAIEDTFVEDLLNSIRAGVNVHGGVELPVTRNLRVVGESRFELMQSFSYLQFRLGAQYMWGAWVAGEER